MVIYIFVLIYRKDRRFFAILIGVRFSLFPLAFLINLPTMTRGPVRKLSGVFNVGGSPCVRAAHGKREFSARAPRLHVVYHPCFTDVAAVCFKWRWNWFLIGPIKPPSARQGNVSSTRIRVPDVVTVVVVVEKLAWKKRLPGITFVLTV